MKKVRILIIVIIITMLGISLFSFQPKPAKAAYCSWGYRSYSMWTGECVSCVCHAVNFTGGWDCLPFEPE